MASCPRETSKAGRNDVAANTVCYDDCSKVGVVFVHGSSVVP